MERVNRLAKCAAAALWLLLPTAALTQEPDEAPFFDIAKEVPDNETSLPLLRTGAHSQGEALKSVLSAEGGLEQTDHNGRNLMHILAMRGGELELMKLILIFNPALAQQPDEQGWTPLFIAYANGHMDVVDHLLERRLDQANRLDKNGLPFAFTFVETVDRPDALQHMITHKLNIFKRNPDGLRLHEVAEKAKHVHSARLLREHYNAAIDSYRSRLKEGKN